MLEQVVARLPRPGLTEQHDGRSTELEDGLLVATGKRNVEPMHLLNASDRHRAHLDEREPAEIARLEATHLEMIAKQNVVLVQQRAPIDRPERAAEPRGVDRRAVV